MTDVTWLVKANSNDYFAGGNWDSVGIGAPAPREWMTPDFSGHPISQTFRSASPALGPADGFSTQKHLTTRSQPAPQ